MLSFKPFCILANNGFVDLIGFKNGCKNGASQEKRQGLVISNKSALYQNKKSAEINTT
jgi:hypothetical protein